MSKLSIYEQNIYNTFLKVSRSGKGFRYRKNFDNISDEKYTYIKKISHVLSNKKIDPYMFFTAPYKLYAEEYIDLKYFTTFNNDSIGPKWVSVFGNHDGSLFQDDEYLPDLDNEGNIQCDNCPEGRDAGMVEWYDLFNQSILESPFQDGHFIYVVIPGSGSGSEVIAPRIIIADAENPLQFHKIMDL